MLDQIGPCGQTQRESSLARGLRGSTRLERVSQQLLCARERALWRTGSGPSQLAGSRRHADTPEVKSDGEESPREKHTRTCLCACARMCASAHACCAPRARTKSLILRTPRSKIASARSVPLFNNAMSAFNASQTRGPTAGQASRSEPGRSSSTVVDRRPSSSPILGRRRSSVVVAALRPSSVDCSRSSIFDWRPPSSSAFGLQSLVVGCRW